MENKSEANDQIVDAFLYFIRIFIFTDVTAISEANHLKRIEIFAVIFCKSFRIEFQSNLNHPIFMFGLRLLFCNCHNLKLSVFFFLWLRKVKPCIR